MMRWFRTAADLAKAGVMLISVKAFLEVLRGTYPCLGCWTTKQPKHIDRVSSIGHWSGAKCPNCGLMHPEGAPSTTTDEVVGALYSNHMDEMTSAIIEDSWFENEGEEVTQAP